MPVQQPNFFYRLFYLFVYAYTFVRHFAFVYFVFSSFRFLAVSFIANVTDIFRFQFGWFFPLVYSRTFLSLSLSKLFFFHFIVLSLDCKCVLMVFRVFFPLALDTWMLYVARRQAILTCIKPCVWKKDMHGEFVGQAHRQISEVNRTIKNRRGFWFFHGVNKYMLSIYIIHTQHSMISEFRALCMKRKIPIIT